jgi:hypothetical protein
LHGMLASGPLIVCGYQLWHLVGSSSWRQVVLEAEIMPAEEEEEVSEPGLDEYGFPPIKMVPAPRGMRQAAKVVPPTAAAGGMKAVAAASRTQLSPADIQVEA